jgi:uncharacterized damage-inducible protein DinB
MRASRCVPGWYGDRMSRSVLSEAFAHHCWATIRLIDACTPLSAEQLASSVPGTYGPILETMRHLVASDRSYLSLLTGGALDDVDEEGLDPASMQTVMEANGPAWEAFVTGEPDTERLVVRHRDDGSESHAPLGIRIVQVIHHGTDHRSQVCTALTNLGIVPPEIDAWDFARANGRPVEVLPQA